jgi:FAD/FMN-containing dehydrogenases
MQTNVKSSLTAEIINEFKKIVGENYVLFDEETLDHYAHDETENLHYLPDVVIKPRTAQEISALMKICNAKKIPVTPRGAGTGLSGGALAHLGGVILAMERMNSILDIDERNLQVTTEPGVITEVLQMTVKEKGCFTRQIRQAGDHVLLAGIFPKIAVALKQLNMVW